jgi:hypothetical protein
MLSDGLVSRARRSPHDAPEVPLTSVASASIDPDADFAPVRSKPDCGHHGEVKRDAERSGKEPLAGGADS